MKKSFAYRGAETWNNLSADIKSKASISTFKNSLTASVQFVCNLVIIIRYSSIRVISIAIYGLLEDHPS